ncbi:MAG: hypothetical protein KJ725_18020, partial [Gammaproteobacteria bacterium]|nr:hypothetical protein [Gammaproteobacteria bacterium]
MNLQNLRTATFLNLGICLLFFLMSSAAQAERKTARLTEEPAIKRLVETMTGEEGNRLDERLNNLLTNTRQALKRTERSQSARQGQRAAQSQKSSERTEYAMLRAQMAALRSEYETDSARLRQMLAVSGLSPQLDAFDRRARQIEDRFEQADRELAHLEAGDPDRQAQARQRLEALLEKALRTKPAETLGDRTQPTFTADPLPEFMPELTIEPDDVERLPAYLSRRRMTPDEQNPPAWSERLARALIPSAHAAPGDLPPEAASCNYTAADLAEDGIDVVLTDEIRALAKQLKYSPARIFRYVSEEIDFEPYYGALKGANGTLHSGKGGSTDQASLLIALLRASNIPARYVKGIAEFKNETGQQQINQGALWLGTKTNVAARNRLWAGQYAASGSATSLAWIQTWVEACIPYADYRGIGADGHGYHWIPLDPSIEDRDYQDGIELNAAFDYDGYLAERSHVLPQEHYQQQIRQTLSNGQDLADVPYTGSKKRLNFDVLPTTLPYLTSFNPIYFWTNTDSPEAAVLPENHRYRLKIKADKQDDTPILAEQTLLMSQTLLKRLTLSFKGATMADQDALDLWRLDGNLESALPCSAIQVTPSLKQEGQEIASGIGAVDICTLENKLEITLSLPELSEPVINKITFENIKAADLQAIQAYGFQASDRLLEERAAQLLQTLQNTANPNTDNDATEGEYLHIVGLQYHRQISDAGRIIGQLRGMTGDSGHHLGVTSTQMKVEYLFDLPFAVHREGMLVDMPGGYSRSRNIVTGNIDWDEFLLSGYAASAYESYIWQENAALDAVSTVRGLQFANEHGIEVLTLTSANWSAQSPKLTSNSNSALNYSTQQRNQIKENYIDKGYTVKIPRSRIEYENWKGAVYVAECNKCSSSPNNFRAGYIIRGGYAGGYTVRPFNNLPTVHYNANLNSGYLSSAITPSLVNTQIADQGIPQNSTTAATGFNWNQVYAG